MSPGRTQQQPEIVDAMLQAARGAAVEREFSLAAMPRLTELASGTETRAHLQARFHLVEAQAAIVGRATAKLRLVCQRCLGSVDVIVDDEFHVVLVATEAEMNQLSDAQDVIIADASQLDLVWLTEEQLLLAMPLVPMHSAPEACGVKIAPKASQIDASNAESNGSKTDDASSVDDAMSNEGEEGVKKTQRPFANLRELLKKG